MLGNGILKEISEIDYTVLLISWKF